VQVKRAFHHDFGEEAKARVRHFATREQRGVLQCVRRGVRLSRRNYDEATGRGTKMKNLDVTETKRTDERRVRVFPVPEAGSMPSVLFCTTRKKSLARGEEECSVSRITARAGASLRVRVFAGKCQGGGTSSSYWPPESPGSFWIRGEGDVPEDHLT